ncbi:ATP synthase D chain, mitochondrial (ATP5H) domain-containing protein [Phthorimaea operculella]|nr:ATP synthase D chain, mitochondrial (ATP5H) domain-containing protein [Phthorimaea operculella]
MAKFTKSAINWVEMEKLVPAEQKVNFLAFKGKSDAYLRRVLANPPEPPKIDWEMYKKTVPVEGLVDKFRSEYEAFKVPYPEDTLTKEVDAQWAKLQEEVKRYVEERQKDIESAQKELSRIKALPRFEDMTMETFHDMYPDQALKPVERPSFWPHDPEEQPGYKEKS